MTKSEREALAAALEIETLRRRADARASEVAALGRHWRSLRAAMHQTAARIEALPLDQVWSAYEWGLADGVVLPGEGPSAFRARTIAAVRQMNGGSDAP